MAPPERARKTEERRDGSPGPAVPKIRVEAPVAWSHHHRGGWGALLGHLRERLHADDGTLFVSAVENAFQNGRVLEEPWVGVVHQVPRTGTQRLPDLDRLVRLPAWANSVPWCRGLWTMSAYTRDYLRARTPEVPIGRILYACPRPEERFAMARLRAALPRRLVLAGHHLRRYQTFCELDAPGYERWILAPAESGPGLARLRARPGVRVVPRIPDADYERLLAESVFYLDLADASAVTTLVECAVRGTPLLVNPLPAVVEYLGPDYPLYYAEPDEAARKLRDDALLERASRYLLDLPIQPSLTPEGFAANLARSAIYRALPTPPSAQRRLRTFDLTVLVCSHSRTADLREVLRRLADQDYPGRFEVIVWNNNVAARQAVDAIAAEIGGDLELKVIHSSENYFCMVRFAAVGLMRSERLMICDDDVLPERAYLRRFVEAYERYGPEVVVCATGHTFLTHTFDEEHPERFWRDNRLRVSHREWHDDTPVHFLHGNSCLISAAILRRALRFPVPDPEFALVDDYWLSFVLGKHLGVPIMKIRADDVLAFAASAEDPTIAMWHNPEVAEQRVRFYIHHMRHGWPALVPPPGPPAPPRRPR
jgi:hypothetical protein